MDEQLHSAKARDRQGPDSDMLVVHLARAANETAMVWHTILSSIELQEFQCAVLDPGHRQAHKPIYPCDAMTTACNSCPVRMAASLNLDTMWFFQVVSHCRLIIASVVPRTWHTKDAHLTFSLGCPRQIALSQGSPAQRTPGWPSAHGSPLPTAGRPAPRSDRIRCELHSQAARCTFCPIQRRQHCRP